MGASYGTTVENGTHIFPPPAFPTKHKTMMWPLKAKIEKLRLGAFFTPYTFKKNFIHIKPYIKFNLSFMNSLNTFEYFGNLPCASNALTIT